MTRDRLIVDEQFTVGSGNVFVDLGFEEGEAHALMVHAELFNLIRTRIRESRWTKARVEKQLRLTKDQATLLMKGQWDEEFSIDELLAIAWRAGLRTKLETRD